MNKSKKCPGSLRPQQPHKSLHLGTLAAAISMATSSMAMAQSDAPDASEDDREIEIVEVYGQKMAPYWAVRSGDMRRRSDLADTPQTMTILTQSQLLDSGVTDLKEILDEQPGITIGTGENGNAFGDRYIIRGHEARSDVFVDGVRDPGMTTRESFAAEQIEITKGPSATFAGRGASGGAVNVITKQANTEQNFFVIDGGVGTDSYHRITLDYNHTFADSGAVRINLLEADEDVPGREPVNRERRGALIAGTIGLTDRLDVSLDYYTLTADDKPDLGSFFDQETRQPYPDIPVYFQAEDFLDTDVDSLTLKLDFDINAAMALQNATRYGTTENGYVATGARGTVREDSDPFAPGAETISLSTHQGWQDVEYFVNQTNLFWDADLGSLEHRLVFGLEYSSEEVQNGVFDVTNTAPTNCVTSGRGGASPNYCIIGPDGSVLPDLQHLMGREVVRGDRDSFFQVDTISAYVMDTVDFNTNWSGFFGLRYDHFDYQNSVRARSGDNTDYDYSDGFVNGHAGIVRNLTESGNVYLAYSTASNINGGESDVGGSCGYGGLCGTPEQVGLSDPERVENIELGTKWKLLDDRLLATAALFQITKSDVMESVGDAYDSLGTLNTGKNRVQGVEFGLTGALTDKLSGQIGATFMDSEVLRSINPENEGLALANFADDSAFVQLRYEPTPAFAFGGTWTYQSEMYAGQPDSAAGYNDEIGDYSVVVPSYDTFDLFVEWFATDSINLRLNVLNVTDEEYWIAAYRSGAFMYLGDGRSVRAALTWSPR